MLYCCIYSMQYVLVKFFPCNSGICILFNLLPSWGADMEKKHVTFRVEPQLVKKLKFLAVEHDKTLTDLFLEALQDLLKKYEKRKSKR
jgi:hypothetical protein